MKKFICTTTIDPPSEAIKRFSEMKDWTLIVAGDKATPHQTYLDINCIYLPPECQEDINKPLSDLIGWKSIQRRNFAFIEAYRLGADIIATVDSDNIPNYGWGENLYIGKETHYNLVNCNNYVFDPCHYAGGSFRDMQHRGTPMDLWLSVPIQSAYTDKERGTFDIQANLWYGSSDVDAYTRILYRDRQCNHCDINAFPFSSNKFSPFNSQNTLITRKVFPYYGVFPFVGRHDDIFFSYYTQANGFRVIYGEPSVVQERNPHNFHDDMEKELFGYRTINKKFIDSIQENPENIWKFLPEKTKQFFDLYRKSFE